MIQVNEGEGRKLKFHIFRYNPQVKGDKPRMRHMKSPRPSA